MRIKIGVTPNQTKFSPSSLDVLRGQCTSWKAFMVLFELIFFKTLGGEMECTLDHT